MSLVDHYWTNQPEKVSNISSKDTGSSDHMLISGTRNTKKSVFKPKIIRKRSFKTFCFETFLNAIRKVKWLDVYLSDDVEVAVNIFTNKITEILDVMAPLKTIQVRTNYLPWMSDVTKENIKLRNELHKKAKDTKLETDWKQYRKLRNNINNTIKQEKIDWQAHKLKTFKKDSKSIWKNVKNWLGWKSNGSPTQLMDELGVMHSKPEKVANIQNDFYINKVKKLRENLPQQTGDPLKLVRKIMRNKKCKFDLQPVGPDLVKTIIKKMKNTSSCGLDNINSYVLKLACDELVPSITHIINLSIIHR